MTGARTPAGLRRIGRRRAAVAALSLLSLVLLPFARPEARWVESGSGQWLQAAELASFCGVDGSPLGGGGDHGRLLCGLCLLPGGGLACQPAGVPIAAPVAQARSLRRVPTSRSAAPARCRMAPPARAPPVSL